MTKENIILASIFRKNNSNIINPIRMKISKFYKGLWLLLLAFFWVGSQQVHAQCDPKAEGSPCEGAALQFRANAPGANTYLWDFGNGFTSTQQNPVYSYSAADTYTVTLTATNPAVNYNCTKSFTVVVKPSPTIKFSVLDPRTQCFEGNRFCVIDSSEAVPGSNLVRWTYLFGDGSLYESLSPKKGDTICNQYIDPDGGFFDLVIELEDANGCVRKVTRDDFFQVWPKLGTLITSNAPTRCDSTEATITNQSRLPLDSVDTYVWDFGDGEVYVGTKDSVDMWFGPNNDGVIKKMYRTNGVFDAKLTINAKFGCSETYTYRAAATNIKIAPKIIANKDSACTNQATFEFGLDQPIPGIRSFLWNFGDPPAGPDNFNNRTLTPEKGYGPGPWMISLNIVVGPCNVMSYDTVLVIGPASTIEIPFGKIAEKERYQCIIRDSVHFPNNSSFYHTDPNIYDEDIFFYDTLFYEPAVTVYKKDTAILCNGDTVISLVTTDDVISSDFNVGSETIGWVEDSLAFDSTMTIFNVDYNMDRIYRRNVKIGGKDFRLYRGFTLAGADTLIFTGDTTMYNFGGADSVKVGLRAVPKYKEFPSQINNVYRFNFDPVTRTGDQTALPRTPSVRGNDHVWRMWDFGDRYAPQCTTDTKANKNVGLNCNFSHDSLPVHWYTPWEYIYRYYDDARLYLQPAPKVIFSKNARRCSPLMVYPAMRMVRVADTTVILPQDSSGTYFGKTFTAGTDEIYDSTFMVQRPKSYYHGHIKHTVWPHEQKFFIPAGVTVFLNNVDDFTTRTITGPKTEVFDANEQFTLDGLCDTIWSVPHTVINPEDVRMAQATTFVKDTVMIINGLLVDTFVTRSEIFIDSAYHREYFYLNTPTCFNVQLFHIDTVHPFRCGDTGTAMLAMMPPNAKGMTWEGGAPCPASPGRTDYFLNMSLRGTKPGCTQSWFEINYDSLAGINNWVAFNSGGVLTTGFTPLPFVLPYDIVAPWGTTILKAYSAGEIGNDPEFRKNGSFTPGLIVGNGFSGGNPPECLDTFWYNDMFRYLYLNARFEIVEPGVEPRTICAGDTAYFLLEDFYQDSISVITWNWGYTTPGKTQQYVEEFYYFADYKGPSPSRNDKDVNWNGEPWKFNYVVRRTNRPVYGVQTIDTIVTAILREWEVYFDKSRSGPAIKQYFEDAGLDIQNYSEEEIPLMLGDGSFGCVDTTGLSDLFPISKRRIVRDSSVAQHGQYVYQRVFNGSGQAVDSVIIEEILHFRDSSIQGYDTLFKPNGSGGVDTIWGVYKFPYWEPQLVRDACDPNITDTVMVRSRGAMFPTLFLDNTVGCNNVHRGMLNVGFFIDAKFEEKAACMGEPLTLYDSVRYYYYGDADFYPYDPGFYPIELTKFWENPARFAWREIKEVDWDVSDGLNDFEKAIKFQHIYDKPGEYQVTMAFRDSMFCHDTLRLTAFVTGIAADFASNSSLQECQNIVSFFDATQVFDPCQLNDTCPQKREACDSIVWWEWDFGDGTRRSVLKNPSHNYTSNGIFTVKLIVHSLLGCTDTIEKQIFVAGPQPEFEILNSRWEDSVIICVDDFVEVVNVSRDPIFQPDWIFDWGDSSTTSVTTRDTFRHQYTKAGEYFIYLTQIDSIQGTNIRCNRIYPDTSSFIENRIYRKVIVLPRAAADFTVSDSVVCPYELITFTSQSDTIYKRFTWEFGDGDTANRFFPEESITHSYKQSGTYQVIMTPWYQPLPFYPTCPDTAKKTITVVDVKASFDIDSTNKPEFCFTNTSQGAVSYRWDFRHIGPDFNEMSTDENPCHNYGEELGQYEVCLIAVSPEGCEDTTCQTINNNFIAKIVPYNVFTPNGDGVNDQFIIEVKGEEEYEIKIYNRWGELVFESTDAQTHWDGTVMNEGKKLCPEGTYFYVINYKLKSREENDGLEPISGTVTLIRD